MDELAHDVVLLLDVELRTCALCRCDDVSLDDLLVFEAQLCRLHRLLQEEHQESQFDFVVELLKVQNDVAGEVELPLVAVSNLCDQILEEVDHQGLLQRQGPLGLLGLDLLKERKAQFLQELRLLRLDVSLDTYLKGIQELLELFKEELRLFDVGRLQRLCK